MKFKHGSLIVLLLVLLGCAHNPTGTTTLSQSEQRLVSHARFAAERSPMVTQIWPGFWSEREPFLLYVPDSAALLVTDKAPIPGYTLIDSALLPEVLQGRSYLYKHPLERLESAFVLAYPVMDYTVTAVQLKPESTQTTDTLIHEAFHAFQQEAFAPEQDQTVPATAFEPTEVRALLHMQQRMLDHMLSASGEQFEGFAHDYLVIRHITEEHLTEPAQQLQQQVERTEGTAELAGIKAVLGRAATNQALENHLRERLASLPNGIQTQMQLRATSYNTGAALATVLTRAGYRWQHAVAEGQHLHNILAEAIQFDASRVASKRENVLQRHDFAHWLEWAARHDRAPREITIAEFIEAQPYTITLIAQTEVVDGRPQLNINFGSGAAGMQRPDNDTVLLPQAENLTFYRSGVRLVAQERPAMINTAGFALGRVTITVTPPELPDLCQAQTSCILENLGLNLDGLVITSEHPVKLNYQSNALTVTVVSD